MFSSAPFSLLFTVNMTGFSLFTYESSGAQNLSIIHSCVGAVSSRASPQQGLYFSLCFITINFYSFFFILVFTLKCWDISNYFIHGMLS